MYVGVLLDIFVFSCWFSCCFWARFDCSLARPGTVCRAAPWNPDLFVSSLPGDCLPQEMCLPYVFLYRPFILLVRVVVCLCALAVAIFARHFRNLLP